MIRKFINSDAASVLFCWIIGAAMVAPVAGALASEADRIEDMHIEVHQASPRKVVVVTHASGRTS